MENAKIKKYKSDILSNFQTMCTKMDFQTFFLNVSYNFLPITNNDFNNNHGGGLKIILNLTPTLKALSVFFFVYSIFFEDNLRLNSKWVYFVNNNSCKNGDKKEFSSCPTIPHSCVVYIACLGRLKKRRCL